MAAFRLRAASGQLTADSFGLGDVFGPLEDMKPIEPRFKTWVPLRVEWPEEGAGDNEAAPVVEQSGDEVSSAPVVEAKQKAWL